MNNPNPFLPQGVFLDQKAKARTRLKIAVYSSISLSVLVLMVLLFQGCKKPTDSAENGTGPDTTTNVAPLANPPADTTASNATVATPAPDSNAAPVAPITSTPPPVMTQTAPPPPPVAEMQEYTIVKGDTLAKIHDNTKVSVKAIMDANPGLDPRKLKIGQKIKIPAPASTSSTAAAPMAAPTAADTAAPGGTITYKVKSGDSLTSISKHYHVSIKAIQSANNLNTTAIKVGQVLKIPGAAAPAPAPAETTPPPPVTAPSLPPAPGPATSAPAPMH